MKKVNVKIDGIEYLIVGDKNEVEIIKVAKYIDEKIKEIRKMAPSLSRISSTVLTTVNIVDDLFQNQEKVSTLESQIQKLKDGYDSTTENVKKEFDLVLEKLDTAENQISILEGEIGKLTKLLEEKETENQKYKKELEKNSSTKNNKNNSTNTEQNNDYLAKINSLELKIQDMEKKVIVAESMATEFQNKAYNLQLNLEELKRKEGSKNE